MLMLISAFNVNVKRFTGDNTNFSVTVGFSVNASVSVSVSV